MGKIPLSMGCIAGFNRYMVECELIACISAFEYAGGFNRYMVECE